MTLRRNITAALSATQCAALLQFARDVEEANTAISAPRYAEAADNARRAQAALAPHKLEEAAVAPDRGERPLQHARTAGRNQLGGPHAGVRRRLLDGRSEEHTSELQSH